MKYRLIALISVVLTAFVFDTVCIGQTQAQTDAEIDLGDFERITPLNTVVEIIDNIDSPAIKDLLRDISGDRPVTVEGRRFSIKSRNTYNAGNELTRRYLMQYFENLGLPVRADNFEMEWAGRTTETANIVADLAGDDSSVLLVTAHFDSTASSEENYNFMTDPAPGADDNGTGVVACLLMAQNFVNYRFGHSVRFVLFSGEEQGMHGSRHYADLLADSGESVIGVINIDMLGPEPEAGQDFLPVIFEDHDEDGIFDPDGLASLFYAVGQAYEFNLDVRPKWAAVVINSDHLPFWYYGYDTVFLNHGSLSGGYHHFTDTVDSIDYDFSTDSFRAAAAAAAHAADIEGYPLTGTAPSTGTGLRDKDDDDDSGCSSAPATAGVSIWPLFIGLLAIWLLRKRTTALLVAIILASSVIAGCGGSGRDAKDDETRHKVDYLVEKGKQALVDKDYVQARRVFNSVLDRYDPDNRQARFGTVFADTLDVMSLLTMLGSYLGLERTQMPLASQRLAAGPISEYAMEVFADIGETAARNADLLEDCTDGGFIFKIKYLPFRFLATEELNLDLEINADDAAIIQSWWQLLAGIFAFINAFDYDAPILDYYDASDYAESLGMVPYINVIVTLLDRSPNFLKLRGGNVGLASLQQARSRLVDSFRLLSGALDNKLNGVGGDKNLFVYKPGDVQAKLKLGGISEQDAGPDSYLAEVGITLYSELIKDLADIGVNIRDSVKPVEMAPTLIRVVFPFVEMIYPLLAKKYPIIVPMYDPIESDMAMVLGAFPSFFALDIGTFFDNVPVLREMLPPVVIGDRLEENLFMLEWECDFDPDENFGYPAGAYGLACTANADLTDQEHFGSARFANLGINAIPPDGIAHPLPYVAFFDPTFAGLLWLDPSEAGAADDPPGYELADNYAINSLIANLLMFVSDAFF